MSGDAGTVAEAAEGVAVEPSSVEEAPGTGCWCVVVAGEMSPPWSCCRRTWVRRSSSEEGGGSSLLKPDSGWRERSAGARCGGEGGFAVTVAFRTGVGAVLSSNMPG
ncbi:hypothetical protein MLD38_037523 [Melastoma candidum]|uniref:Uncharacterized protein n=1 Tax=Melastoma candidum TaxID=119954 RepID=A0ACB9LPS0_9MYRT|nr:hypothetical protein MLD38_037523 [Melastoma candidum]